MANKTVWKRLRVDMTSKELTWQDWPEELLLVGGRSAITHIMNTESDPTCEPLGPNNILIMTSGVIPDYRIPGSGRLSVGGKSPLTGGIKEANAGGSGGFALASAGIRALTVHGAPKKDECFILLISNCGKAELLPVPQEIKMAGTYKTADFFREKYGKDTVVITIGPSGEMLYRGAGVAVTDKDGVPSRFAGRGGMGAVMGSKGLKAVVLPGKLKTLNPAKEEEFKAARARYVKAVLDNPMTGKSFPEYGTLSMLGVMNEISAFPSYNFRYGHSEDANKIDANALVDLITTRGGKGRKAHACMQGCLAQCSNVVPGEDGEVLVSPLEYESVCLLGSNLGIFNLDDIARLNWECNDIGVDTIEIGGSLGVAMEAGLAQFGDVEACHKFMREMREGTTLGRVLGNGPVVTGAVFGVTRVAACKGQGFPAYDPRGIKGMGVTYATSPQGADHTAGHMLGMVSNHHVKEGQKDGSLKSQLIRSSVDGFGFCSFYTAPTTADLSLLTDMVSSIYDIDMKAETFFALGREYLKGEIEFNKRAGITQDQNDLPEFFKTEGLPDIKLTFDVDKKDLETIFEPLTADK